VIKVFWYVEYIKKSVVITAKELEGLLNDRELITMLEGCDLELLSYNPDNNSSIGDKCVEIYHNTNKETELANSIMNSYEGDMSRIFSNKLDGTKLVVL